MNTNSRFEGEVMLKLDNENDYLKLKRKPQHEFNKRVIEVLESNAKQFM